MKSPALPSQPTRFRVLRLCVCVCFSVCVCVRLARVGKDQKHEESMDPSATVAFSCVCVWARVPTLLSRIGIDSPF